jgi:hypothetical protein
MLTVSRPSLLTRKASKTIPAPFGIRVNVVNENAARSPQLLVKQKRLSILNKQILTLGVRIGDHKDIWKEL